MRGGAACRGNGFAGRCVAVQHLHREGDRTRACCHGDLFQRLLALPSANAVQRARAVLVLARDTCREPPAGLAPQAQQHEASAVLLHQADAQGLPPVLKNRLHLRCASAWSTVAFERTRQHNDSAAVQAATRALDAMARVQAAELPEHAQTDWNNAVMRFNATRWAAQPRLAKAESSQGLTLSTEAGSEAGQTCVRLHAAEAKKSVKGPPALQPLASRCTHSVVWAALVVQPMAGWQELWLCRKRAGVWTVQVLLPSSTAPELGCAEWAGWVPGGRQVLVAREGCSEGRYSRSYELADLDSLATLRHAKDAKQLGAFRRWQAPQWAQHTFSLR